MPWAPRFWAYIVGASRKQCTRFRLARTELGTAGQVGSAHARVPALLYTWRRQPPVSFCGPRLPPEDLDPLRLPERNRTLRVVAPVGGRLGGLRSRRRRSGRRGLARHRVCSRDLGWHRGERRAVTRNSLPSSTHAQHANRLSRGRGAPGTEARRMWRLPTGGGGRTGERQCAARACDRYLPTPSFPLYRRRQHAPSSSGYHPSSNGAVCPLSSARTGVGPNGAASSVHALKTASSTARGSLPCAWHGPKSSVDVSAER